MTNWDIVIGGTAFPFASYGAIVTGMQGVGMAPVRNVITNYAISPGGAHQRTKVDTRSLIIQAALPGTSMANLHRLRGDLIAAIRPDRDGMTQQPSLLRYTGGSVPVEIEAYYDDGLGWSNPVGYTETLAMRFVAPDPYFRGTADLHTSVTPPAFKRFLGIAAYTAHGWDISQAVSLPIGADNGFRDLRRILVSENDEILHLGFSYYQNGTAVSFTGVTAEGMGKWSNETWSLYAGSAGISAVFKDPGAPGQAPDWRAAEYHAGTMWIAVCADHTSLSGTGIVSTTLFSHSATTPGTWTVQGTATCDSGSRAIKNTMVLKSSGGNLYYFGEPTTYTGSTFAANNVLIRTAQGFTPLDDRLVFGYGGIARKPNPIVPTVVDVLDTGLNIYLSLSASTSVFLPNGTFASSVLRGELAGTSYTWSSIGTCTGFIYSMAQIEDSSILVGGDMNSINGVSTGTSPNGTGQTGTPWALDIPTMYARSSIIP
jgi:hypothetical protein